MTYITKKQAEQYINSMAQNLAKHLGGTKEDYMEDAIEHFEEIAKRDNIVVTVL